MYVVVPGGCICQRLETECPGVPETSVHYGVVGRVSTMCM